MTSHLPPVQHRPRRRFGQHFLHDQQVLLDIVSVIDGKPDNHLVELGPGKGALTSLLLRECKSLDVIEIDRDLVAVLTAQYRGIDNLRIHCADMLQTDFAKLRTGSEKIRIVGNLPYNISTPLIFHLLKQRCCIEDIHLLMQKEVVNRICATPGSKDYGKLSIMVQYHCQTHRLFDVFPESFTPRPRVTSSVIRLIPGTLSGIKVNNEESLGKLVSQAFSQRRKTLRNSLKSCISESDMRLLDIDPAARAETLSLNDFARLSDFFNAKTITSSESK